MSYLLKINGLLLKTIITLSLLKNTQCLSSMDIIYKLCEGQFFVTSSHFKILTKMCNPQTNYLRGSVC